MYYFSFLVLTRHINPLKSQPDPAVLSISTSAETIAYKFICLGILLFLIYIIYQHPSHKTYFGKYWYKTVMASLKSDFLVLVSLAKFHQREPLKRTYLKEITIWATTCLYFSSLPQAHWTEAKSNSVLIESHCIRLVLSKH